jgi:hypothetical protein
VEGAAEAASDVRGDVGLAPCGGQAENEVGLDIDLLLLLLIAMALARCGDAGRSVMGMNDGIGYAFAAGNRDERDARGGVGDDEGAAVAVELPGPCGKLIDGGAGGRLVESSHG